MSMQGKTAIVTGAARGIGRAISCTLASQGVNLVLNYAGNDQAAAQTKQLCEAFGVEVVLAKANVAEEAAAESIFALAEKHFSGLDILVNNAGITRDSLLPRMATADFEAVLDVNLKGAFHCCKLAFKPMSKARSGRIINISSVVGLSGNAGQANYAASKAGLIGLTKSLAKEYARRNITVNAVAPGFIATDMTADLPEQVQQSMLANTPLGRFGTAEEVAAAVAFFASEAAAYITGEVLRIDGGMAM